MIPGLFRTTKIRNPNIEIRNKHEIQKPNVPNKELSRLFALSDIWTVLGFAHSDFEHSNLSRISIFGFQI